jgi:hypothetical protein
LGETVAGATLARRGGAAAAADARGLATVGMSRGTVTAAAAGGTGTGRARSDGARSEEGTTLGAAGAARLTGATAAVVTGRSRRIVIQKPATPTNTTISATAALCEPGHDGRGAGNSTQPRSDPAGRTSSNSASALSSASATTSTPSVAKQSRPSAPLSRSRLRIPS